jgi:suppressor for copper-sensitivity B
VAAAGFLATLLVLLALGFALADRLPAAIRRSAPAAVATYVLAVVAIAAALPGATRPEVAARDDHWRTFDEAAIPALVAEGRVIFVDVTADWCITCQANKALVLRRGEVARRLGGGEVVSMRADWTKPDPVIARYLTKFGRYGIPFNVVYGPNAPQGIPLPELLTSDAVLAALDQAHASARPVAKRP